MKSFGFVKRLSGFLLLSCFPTFSIFDSIRFRSLTNSRLLVVADDYAGRNLKNKRPPIKQRHNALAIWLGSQVAMVAMVLKMERIKK